MKVFKEKVWFVTGSQELYGEDVLKAVASHSEVIVAGFNSSNLISTSFVNAGTVTSPQEILAVCQAANNDSDCIGLVFWMHTFSPAKMWIAGLKQLNKPFVDLHTQFNAEIPWNKIDMNFMNTNQSAHGGREFGYIGARMGLKRKVITGHWEDSVVHQELDSWCRAAIGWHEAQSLRVARFGDNMNHVAVTEGNKVSAQIQFGFEVHGYGLGELADAVNAVSDDDVGKQVDIYCTEYRVSPELLNSADNVEILKREARLELGIERFLQSKGCKAFVNTFENLSGLSNLPGLATQRLMAKGYGYGGEGDWKTAAMTRIVKVMCRGLQGGTSFMEDYTYNFSHTDQVLGAHMLEVCPSISAEKPSLEIHRHTIGCECDVARLIFSGKEGQGVNISLVEMDSHYRLIANTVKAVKPEHKMPSLPVAHTLWEPMPDLKTAATAWVYAGGAHHTTFSQAINMDMVTDFADIAGMELLVIDKDTKIPAFRQQLQFSQLVYRFSR